MRDERNDVEARIVAANVILDRGFGKPVPAEAEREGEGKMLVNVISGARGLDPLQNARFVSDVVTVASLDALCCLTGAIRSSSPRRRAVRYVLWGIRRLSIRRNTGFSRAIRRDSPRRRTSNANDINSQIRCVLRVLQWA
jgi:hypothetical protein